MIHVLVLDRVHEAGLALLRTRPDIEVELLPSPTEADIERAIPGADALLLRTQRLTARMIDLGRRLRVIARHGVGYDNVDLEALDRRGIPLVVTGPVNTVSVAEHTLFLMLALAKHGIPHDAAVRHGDWGLRNAFHAWELNGRTLLLLGFGQIGRAVARLALAFGMTVAAYDPYVAAEVMAAAGVVPVAGLAAGLAAADVISVHLPLSDATRNLLDRAALARMRPGAVVISTARGGVVDERALAEALAAGRLGGAGLDVFEDEPPAPGNPLLGLSNVVLSPHVAGLTAECAQRLAEVSARNILDAVDGRLDPALVVNRQVLGIARPDAG